MANVRIEYVSKVSAQGHDLEPASNLSAKIVAPGDNITLQDDFMRGHGTYITQNSETMEKELNSSLAGVVERIDKLVSVRPLKTRYSTF